MRRPFVSLLVAAALVGCGAPPRVSHEEYVGRAESLCRQRRDEALALARRAQESPQAMSEVLRRAVDLGDQALATMTGVRPPEEDDDEVEAILDDLRAGVGDLRRALRAAEAGQARPMLGFAGRAGERLRAASEAAVAYGAEDCGFSGQGAAIR